MPECKDIINYIITSLGLLVTGIFSYLVWKATQQSTEVAKASYKLSESIINSQLQLKAKIKEEYIRNVCKNINEVIEGLKSQKSALSAYKINNIPRSCGLTEEQIAEFFSDLERQAINNAWESLDNYIQDYWTDTHGKIKESFIGNEAEAARKYINKPLDVFNKLVELMEKGRRSNVR